MDGQLYKVATRRSVQTQLLSVTRETDSAHGMFVFNSPPGMEESGYAARWLLRVAEPQLPALPERTCPLIRDDLVGTSEFTLNWDDWLAAVGVVALKSSCTSLPLKE